MITPIIRFDNTPRRAFVEGMFKGMAAPVMIFGSFGAVLNIPEVPSVSKRLRAESPWNAVGAHLRIAMEDGKTS